jgi:hypothetical protein
VKIIDCLAQKKTSHKAGGISRFWGNFSRGLFQQDTRAKEIIKNSFGKMLDNHYFLMCDATLEGLDVPIPFILVGPPGIWVIYPSDVKGVYRANESVWEELNNTTHKYRIARPNLLTRTSLMTKAVTSYLSVRGFKVSTTEAALYFADPGVHVDATRPIARIILADGLDRFTAGVAQVASTLEPQEVQKIVDALGGEDQSPGEALATTEKLDEFSYRESTSKTSIRPSRLGNVPRGEPAFAKRVPFSRRQWVLLGSMTLLNIIILVSFLVLIYMTTR